MATINAIDFTVPVDDLQSPQVIERTYSDELEPNQVLLKIDQFSFTSNNITYGVVGDRMSYWKFFPTQSGFGIIPTWGFANVIASNHPEITVGQRYYGYYPMSSHLMVTVGRVSSFGFTDQTKHRQELSSVYNFYTNTENDPTYSKETEALISIFRPLFVTSFLIDDLLDEENFFEASQVLLTSASSKTAQALAFQIAHRKEEHNLKVDIIGLTSQKNITFVDGLGWYDKVMSYDEIIKLNALEKVVVIDFTGNYNTQYQLQTHFGDRLAYNCLVGLVDWQNQQGEKPLPNKGEFFFAPTRAEKRQQDWGPSGFQQKVGMAWQQFATAVVPMLTVKKHEGPKQLQKLYLDMLTGNIDPMQGNMVRLSGL